MENREIEMIEAEKHYDGKAIGRINWNKRASDFMQL